MIEANDQVDNAFQKGLNTWPNSWSWHVRCLIIKNVVTARFITSTNNLLRHNILNYTIIKMRNKIATNPPTKMAYWKNIESKVGNMQFRGWMSWWGNIDITRSKHPCMEIIYNGNTWSGCRWIIPYSLLFLLFEMNWTHEMRVLCPIMLLLRLLVVLLPLIRAS